MFQRVPLRKKRRMALYRDVDHQTEAVDAIEAQAARMRSRFKGRTFWMVNSTAKGGGVAEMLPTLCGMLNELGITTKWGVIRSTDPVFFGLTKKLHNFIHGLCRDGDTAISQAERATYDAVQRENAKVFLGHLGNQDIILVHDPQPAGLASCLLAKKKRLRFLWQCHIGVPFDNAATRAAWKFLKPQLEPYQHAIFTAQDYVPPFLRRRASLNPPAIDPLSEKNCHLPMDQILASLSAVGLYESSITSVIADLVSHVKTILPNGCLSAPVHLPIVGPPICLQVSRWDHLKGFIPLLKGFAKMKAEVLAGKYVDLPEEARSALYESRLVLAGPDPGGVADDPEGVAVLREVIDEYVRLPEEIRNWIFILLMPENARVVNALQRSASVIIQNSLQEGFGLTATEAMWKGVPIIATTAGGLKLQVRDGIDGLLIKNPESPAEIRQRLVKILTQRKEREEMALHAHARVADNFLVTRQLKDYLDVIEAQL